MDNNLNNGQQFQQQQFQQPQFQQPVYQQPEDNSVMSTGQWMLTTFLLALPCVGLILAFVWGFGSGNLNRKNYCRSWLIWQLIGIVVSILFVVMLAAMGVSLMSVVDPYYYNY